MERPQPSQSVALQPTQSGDLVRIDAGESVVSVWLAASASNGLYLRMGKRFVDTACALAGLLVTSPVLLACAVAIRLDSRGPVFFRQRRVGRHGKTFRIFKFRTMIVGSDGSKLTASGDIRVTRVGKILRKSKLDEIPQLLNVLRGEMSLVGPRPEVPEYTEKYTLHERRVLEVRPGITGPASLAYIDEEQLLASVEDRERYYVDTLMKHKLRYDLAYCGHICLLEDMRIIFRTGGSLVGLRSSNTDKAAVVAE